jgi:hypothetical protein
MSNTNTAERAAPRNTTPLQRPRTSVWIRPPSAKYHRLDTRVGKPLQPLPHTRQRHVLEAIQRLHVRDEGVDLREPGLGIKEHDAHAVEAVDAQVCPEVRGKEVQQHLVTVTRATTREHDTRPA